VSPRSDDADATDNLGSIRRGSDDPVDREAPPDRDRQDEQAECCSEHEAVNAEGCRHATRETIPLRAASPPSFGAAAGVREQQCL